MNRRDFLLATTAVAASPLLLKAEDAPGFKLAKLPYAYDALEPVIDAETMTIHHSKHHQAYVDNLNKALAGQTDWLKMPIAELVQKIGEVPEKIRPAVQNNGGGHWNHDFFWSIMTKPGTGGEPTGDLLKAIDTSFGTLDGFKKEFLAAALGRFGSGWAWLVPGKTKPLEIVSTPNQDSPLMKGVMPLLGIDVWEHAYYLKYRNLRAKYVEAWYSVIDWKKIAYKA
ncbi:MAG: superoxide dismutase [Fimbriiglobus sp.]